MESLKSKSTKILELTKQGCWWQGYISSVTYSYPELTEDHVLTSAYVKIFRTVMSNAVNEGV